MPVAGNLHFSEVGAGTYFSCGITPEHEAFCWGVNIYGQLGNGGTRERHTPVRVGGMLQFRQISVGNNSVGAVTLQDQAYCWGSNVGGQLGNSSGHPSSTPIPVAGGLSFIQVSLSGHGCGVTTSNVAYCWSGEPEAVIGGMEFRSVSAGSFRNCGITTAGAAYCWGSNDDGELGDGTTTDHPAPNPVAAPSLTS